MPSALQGVGLVEVEAFPVHEATVSLTLDALCRGAEALYP